MRFHPFALFFAISLVFTGRVCAQATAQDISLLTQLNAEVENVAEAFVAYSVRAVHSSNPKRIAAAEQLVIDRMQAAKQSFDRLKPEAHQADLVMAYREYITLYLGLMRNDWVQVKTREAISRQSEEALEEYFEFLNELDARGDSLDALRQRAFLAFCQGRNIRITDGADSKLERQAAKLARLNQHVRAVDLAAFRATYWDGLFSKALSEQRNPELAEILAKLEAATVKARTELNATARFAEDDGLRVATLRFVNHINSLGRNAYAKMAELQRKGMNSANDVKAYNQLASSLNQAQAREFGAWSAAREAFIERHTPRRAARK